MSLVGNSQEPPVVILLVFNEKEIETVEMAVDQCCSLSLGSRRNKIGAIKIFKATKAIEACQKLNWMHQRHEGCHGVLMGWQFTIKGKEDYADAIRKVMLEKYPDIPIVLFGQTKRGGDPGKAYHHAMDWVPDDGPDPIAKLLLQLKEGQIKPEFHAKEKGSKMLLTDDDIARRGVEESAYTAPVPVVNRAARKSLEAAGKPLYIGKVPDSSSPGIHSPGFSSPRGHHSMDVNRFGGMGGLGGMSGGMSGGMGYGGMDHNMGMMHAGGMSGGMGYGGMDPNMGMMNAVYGTEPLHGHSPLGMGAAPAAVPAPTPENMKMLADEVQRLSILVEEKRRRQAGLQ